MIESLINEIKKNKSTRKNSDMVHEIIPTEFKFPLSFNLRKTKTRWEKFAEEKGIQKRKKSSMVYSEEYKKWLPVWGSASKKNLEMREGIVETEEKRSISQIRREKEKRISKNRKNMLANIKRAK